VELAAQGLDRGVIAAEVDGVGQQHDPDPGDGVEGEAGAGETGVRDRRRRPAGAQDAGGVAGAHPAEAAAAIQPGRLARGGLAPQRGRHGAVGVAHPPRGVLDEVVAGAEQAGVTGDAVEYAGVLVVHDAIERQTALVAFGRGEPGRRDAQRRELGLAEVERGGDQAAHRVVEPLPGDRRHQLAEHHEAEVRVDHLDPGRRFRFGGGQRRHQLLGRIAPPVELLGGGQSRGMRQELADGYLAQRAEAGQVPGHVVVEADPALPGQREHRRRGRHDLGQRRQVEHGIVLHPSDIATGGVGEANGPPGERALALADGGDRAGDAAVADRGGEQGAGGLEIFGCHGVRHTRARGTHPGHRRTRRRPPRPGPSAG
jgi:hypothetical protein